MIVTKDGCLLCFTFTGSFLTWLLFCIESKPLTNENCEFHKWKMNPDLRALHSLKAETQFLIGETVPIWKFAAIIEAHLNIVFGFESLKILFVFIFSWMTFVNRFIFSVLGDFIITSKIVFFAVFIFWTKMNLAKMKSLPDEKQSLYQHHKMYLNLELPNTLFWKLP